MTVTCPGCQSELDPSNTNCPVCLRPRSRKEIMAGLSGTRRPPPMRWGRILLAVVVIGALGFGGLQLWQMKPLPEPPAPAAVVKPAGPADAAPSSPQAEPQPSDGAPRPTVSVAPQAGSSAPQAPEPAPEPRSRRRAAPKPKPEGWRVEGQVYDLFSLKPLPGTRIVFQDKNTGDAHTAASDAKGRYVVYLPKVREGGYEVTVSRKGYSDSYFEEMAPPYRSQSIARRREAAEQLSESAMLHVPLLPEFYSDTVPYDLILFPRQ
jgi:hypothetical protein